MTIEIRQSALGVDLPAISKSGWAITVLFLLASLAKDALAVDPNRVDRDWCDPHLGSVLDRNEDGIALALSGGGYRAMLFHAGALAKLNDAGLLAELRIVSAVSGGSIAAGVLAKAWPALEWDKDQKRATNFKEKVIVPIMDHAQNSFGLLKGAVGLLPFTSVSERLVRHYDDFFGTTRLAELNYDKAPNAPEVPLFVFNATSLQTGETIQFRPLAIGGPYIGWTDPGTVTLSQAVAASSSFPPFFGPLKLSLESDEPRKWHRCEYESLSWVTDPRSNLAMHSIVEPMDDTTTRAYRRSLILVDGGVSDNLGLDAIQTVNTVRQQQGGKKPLNVLVSDGGSPIFPEEQPNGLWSAQALRVIDLVTSAPSAVRTQDLIAESFKYHEWPSIYWGLNRNPRQHDRFIRLSENFDERLQKVLRLASAKTRLTGFGEETNELLVNWGYVTAHHALPYIPRLMEGCAATRTAYCSPPFEVEVKNGGFLSGRAQCAKLAVQPPNCPDWPPALGPAERR